MRIKGGKLTYSEDGSATLVVQGISDGGVPSISVIKMDEVGSDGDRAGFNNIMEAVRRKLVEEHGE